MLFARVGRGDHDADGFLVETLEASVALQIFQVAADRALPQELFALSGGDQALSQQFLSPSGLNRPAFSLGKSLAEEFEIGERFHGVDSLVTQLVAQ